MNRKKKIIRKRRKQKKRKQNNDLFLRLCDCPQRFVMCAEDKFNKCTICGEKMSLFYEDPLTHLGWTSCVKHERVIKRCIMHREKLLNRAKLALPSFGTEVSFFRKTTQQIQKCCIIEPYVVWRELRVMVGVGWLSDDGDDKMMGRLVPITNIIFHTTSSFFQLCVKRPPGDVWGERLSMCNQHVNTVRKQKHILLLKFNRQITELILEILYGYSCIFSLRFR